MRFIAVIAWTVAALNIIGILDDTITVLDEAAIPIGEDDRISLLGIITGVLSLVIFIWLALVIARILEQRISQLSALNPSARVLIAKVVTFVLVAWNTPFIYAVAPASILGATAVCLLELFVAFLQAYIFTVLSALFIGMAVHPH